MTTRSLFGFRLYNRRVFKSIHTTRQAQVQSLFREASHVAGAGGRVRARRRGVKHHWPPPPPTALTAPTTAPVAATSASGWPTTAFRMNRIAGSEKKGAKSWCRTYPTRDVGRRCSTAEVGEGRGHGPEPFRHGRPLGQSLFSVAGMDTCPRKPARRALLRGINLTRRLLHARRLTGSGASPGKDTRRDSKTLSIGYFTCFVKVLCHMRKALRRSTHGFGWPAVFLSNVEEELR